MTSSNVDLRNYVISRQHFIKYPPKPPGVGWVNLFLGENKSRIYPHMRANYGRGPTVVSKKGGGTDTQSITLCKLPNVKNSYSRGLESKQMRTIISIALCN